jgi:hypothetical protein
VRGTVSKVEWINPHAWIHMDVKKADGTVERWMFEAGTPNTLMRRGLTKNSLAIGTEIVADGYQSKDGICEPACRANGRDLTLPDGTTLFLGNDGGRGQEPENRPKPSCSTAGAARCRPGSRTLPPCHLYVYS